MTFFELVGGARAGAWVQARLVEGVASSKLVVRVLSANAASGVPGRFRTRIEGGWLRAAVTYNHANTEMNNRSKNVTPNMALTVSRIALCSVTRPRRQGSATPRKKQRALDSCGARDAIIWLWRETVRV